MAGQKIQFIDTHYKTLFTIDDGAKIEIDIEGGTVQWTCRFLDEYHTEIGGRVYHIHEFAEAMEKYNRTYRPVTE
jgi:hypothetical protein